MEQCVYFEIRRGERECIVARLIELNDYIHTSRGERSRVFRSVRNTQLIQSMGNFDIYVELAWLQVKVLMAFAVTRCFCCIIIHQPTRLGTVIRTFV